MNYIDLGLPSETLWASENLEIEGKTMFLQSEIPSELILPSKEQCEELIKFCTITQLRNHDYLCKGPNGRTITFKPLGWMDTNNLRTFDTNNSYYWTRTKNLVANELYAMCLEGDHTKEIVPFRSIYFHAIRLVKGEGKFVTIF